MNKKKKISDTSVFEIDTGTESKIFQCIQNHIKSPIDFQISGIGVRFYTNGKKYQGNFQNNKREGYGVLLGADGKKKKKKNYRKKFSGKVEYDGFWKSDKREGQGYQVKKKKKKFSSKKFFFLSDG